MDYDRFSTFRYPAFRIVLIYALFGCLWIYTSDEILALISTDPVVMTRIAQTKGMLFMGITSLLLYVLIYRYDMKMLASRKTLQEAEERYRILFEHAPYGILLVDQSNYKILAFNEAAHGNLGYMRAEFAALNIADFEVLDDLEAIRERGRQLAKSGRITFETIQRTKEGAERNVVVDLQVIDIGGLPTAISMMRDITEQKRAFQAVEESEERYRLLAGNMQDVIWQLDPDMRFLYISPSDEQLRGYPAEEILGRSAFEIMTPASAAKVKSAAEARRSALDAGEKVDTLTIEIEQFCRNGGTVWVETKSTPVYDSAGRLSGYVGITRDISERRKIEQSLRESERQLLHTQKLESLGVLAGGIAHDFNNLLAAILGNLDLSLLKLPQSSPVRNYIESSMRACQMAADLTRQMLAYSGKGFFQLKEIDLNVIVHENSELFRTIIPRNVSLSLATGENLPLVEADPGQIQQVVMNLITNAAEAVGAQPGAITLATGVMDCDAGCIQRSCLDEKPLPGEFVYLEVTDNGCGMGPDTRLRLFEPFFTTKFTGRGLGMAATLGIVRTHKGVILLESEPGQGSTFRILLPARGHGGVTADDKAVESASEAGVMSGTRRKMLVIDDEDYVRSLGSEYARLLGFEPIDAADGAEALVCFRDHAEEIALVILDLTMPNMDGVATFYALRQIRGDVPVILSSGFSEQAVAEQFAGDQPDSYIQKPFLFKDLEQKVKALLDTPPKL